MDIYEELIKNSDSLKDAEETDVSGIDSFLLPDKIKVASLGDLSDFFRVSVDTLVHKAEKDLWRVSEKNGDVIIERLFNPESKEPLKV